MTCYYIPDVKTLQILSLHFVPTLQSAVYILYPICSLLSAFCTNRYPWHQYRLFLVTFIRTIHTIYKKIPVYELIRHFLFFSALLSFCKNIGITYNVSSNPPTLQKITLACIACPCFCLVVYGPVGIFSAFHCINMVKWSRSEIMFQLVWLKGQNQVY